MNRFIQRIKEFFKSLSGQEKEKTRKGIMLGAAVVGTALSFVLLFVPFFFFRVAREVAGEFVLMDETLKVNNAWALFNEGVAAIGIRVIGLVIFFFWLVAFLITLIFLAKALISFFTNERKLAKNTKTVLILSTVTTGLFSVSSWIVCAVIRSTKNSAETANNWIPLMIVLIVDVLFAAFVGILRWANKEDADETEKVKKKRKGLNLLRLELFLFSLVITVLTMFALLSNILTVKFEGVSYYIHLEDIKISGLDFLKDYETLDKGGQVIVYILFTMITVQLTVFFLSLVSYVSRSGLFYKLTLANIVFGAVCCLFVGLFGKYYEIVQALNDELISSLIFGASENGVNELYDYKVTSHSLYFFLGAVAVLAGLLIRRPYSKGIAYEQALAEKSEGETQTIKGDIAITDVPKKAMMGMGGAVSGNPAAPEQVYYADPCPAFTELDMKSELFQKELEEKRLALFEEPTLPKLVQFIVSYARDSRLHLSYTAEDIATFIAGLGATKLSILQGMSGTGKTSLPKIFSEALMSRCEIVEVESSWRDKNELLGYYNEFSKTYTPKKFTQALYRARLNPDVLTFIVLDEMNLSRIEYYFSDFLSLMENEEDKREIKLLNVGLYRTEEGERIPYQGLTDGHTVKIPANVWFIGTANRDESTFEISDKVYDRAHTMNFNKRAAKVSFYNDPVPPRYLPAETLTRMLEEAKKAVNFNIDTYPVIGEVEKLLAPYNISFGNRIAMQIESFVSVYCSCFSINESVIHNAVESILLSKVVSKLELKSVDNKEQLAAEFDKLDLRKCGEFIRKLNED